MEYFIAYSYKIPVPQGRLEKWEHFNHVYKSDKPLCISLLVDAKTEIAQLRNYKMNNLTILNIIKMEEE